MKCEVRLKSTKEHEGTRRDRRGDLVVALLKIQDVGARHASPVLRYKKYEHRWRFP